MLLRVIRWQCGAWRGWVIRRDETGSTVAVMSALCILSFARFP
jgi:hypothetical protein